MVNWKSHLNVRYCVWNVLSSRVPFFFVTGGECTRWARWLKKKQITSNLYNQIALWSVNDSFFLSHFDKVFHRSIFTSRAIVNQSENRFLSECPKKIQYISINKKFKDPNFSGRWSSHPVAVFGVMVTRAWLALLSDCGFGWKSRVPNYSPAHLLWLCRRSRTYSISMRTAFQPKVNPPPSDSIGMKRRTRNHRDQKLPVPGPRLQNPKCAHYHSGYRSFSPLASIAGPPIIVVAARVAARHLLIKCLFTRCFHLAQASLDALVFSSFFFWRPLRMVSNYKSAECAGIEIMLR